MWYAVVLIIAILALFMNFKAKFIIEKLLKKEASEQKILKVKLLSAIICILDFLAVLIWF